nr:hypothetical protein [Acidobacteriota bacterium]
VPERDIAYRHVEYVATDAAGGSESADLVPGTRVLAFLDRSQADVARAGRPTFESAEYPFGIRQLANPQRAAYLERLETLARIGREAEHRGEVSADDLVEWIVATAENPLTRRDGTRELRSAQEALAEAATHAGTTTAAAAEDLKVIEERFHAAGGKLSGQPPAAILGAHLNAAHKTRLTAALTSTDTTSEGDRELFSVVRAWNEKTARQWLVRRLSTAEAEPGRSEDELWWLIGLAEELENERLRAIGAEASKQQQEIAALLGDDAARLRQERLDALVQDLRRQFVAELSRK